MKKHIVYECIVVFILCVVFSCSNKEQENKKWILDRFWETTTMNGESLFFIQENDNELPRASLLFKPDKILSIKNAAEDVTYIEGKDYVFKPGSRIISLTKDSRISFMKKNDMYPQFDSPKSIKKYRFGESNLFFSEGHVFHDLQTAVTYKHSDQ